MKKNNTVSKHLRDFLEKNDYKQLAKVRKIDLIRFRDEQYGNIVLFAVRKCQLRTLKTLLSRFTDEQLSELTEGEDSYHRSALMIAAVVDDANKLQLLHRQLNFNINNRNEQGLSALTHAIKRNATAAFNYLLLHGAKFTEKEQQAINDNPTFANYFYSRPVLSIAIQSKNTNAIKAIFDHLKTANTKKKQKFFKYKESDGNTSIALPDISQLNTIKARRDWGDLFSESISPIKQAGRKPRHTAGLVTRPPRSYSETREQQLLKQLATQLHLYLENKAHDGKLVETQMMHLAIGSKHNLFIAVNEHSVSLSLQHHIPSMDQLKAIMSQNHSKQIKDHEGKQRSQRYSQKLAARIWNDKPTIPDSKDADDFSQYQHLAKLLRTANLKTIELSGDEKANQKLISDLLLGNDNTIFLVTIKPSAVTDKKQKSPTPKLGRHAEEFLCDIAEVANALAATEKLPIYSSVGGKKRPCMSCSGRMTGIISNFSQYPGLFWKQTIGNQTPEAAQRTLSTLASQSSCITSSHDHKTHTDYASASDSEVEAAVLIK